MSQRVQKVLDGELEPGALRPDEAAELDAHEEAIDGALAGVRAERAPDVTADVMHRIAALPRHGRSAGPAPWRRALDWLWAPRQVSLRPAWAVAAAAAALAGVVVLGSPRAAGPVGPAGGAAVATPAAPGAPVAGAVLVHFRLDAAGARSVQLAGDFTGWAPRYALSESAPGIWTVVVPVEPGVHQYAFVVDGERWVADPVAPVVDDGFGGRNSRLDVIPPQPRREL